MHTLSREHACLVLGEKMLPAAAAAHTSVVAELSPRVATTYGSLPPVICSTHTET